MKCIACDGTITGPFGDPCTCSPADLKRMAEAMAPGPPTCSICERTDGGPIKVYNGWLSYAHDTCLKNAHKIAQLAFDKGKKIGRLEQKVEDAVPLRAHLERERQDFIREYRTDEE